MKLMIIERISEFSENERNDDTLVNTFTYLMHNLLVRKILEKLVKKLKMPFCNNSNS